MLGHRGCRLGDHLSRRSPRCRRGPSSRPRCEAAQEQRRSRRSRDHDPLVVTKRRTRSRQGAHRCDGAGGVGGTGRSGELSGRHDDRIAARRLKADEIAQTARNSSPSAPTISPRRPSASVRDDAATFLRDISSKGIFAGDPFVTLIKRAWAAGSRRRRARPGDAARHQARHLRRTWRGSRLDRILRGGRLGLRVVLPLSCADRTARGGAGDARQDQGKGRVIQRSREQA